MNKTVTSRIGQRMKERETLIGSSPRAARKQGIRVRPGAVLPRAALAAHARLALLGWIEDDARYLAQRIGAFAQSHKPARAR